MADDPIKLVLLTGTWGLSATGIVRRLAERGIVARVVSAGEGEVHEGLSCPGLTDRWRRPWAVRWLAGPEGPGRPDLLHVVGADLDEAGLALAEHWRVPYVLSVVDYLPPGGRLRLSRRWCRALIATSPTLADDLARGAGVPRSWVVVVPAGVDVVERAGPIGGPERVPVVGTAGALKAGSGTPTFLDAARRLIADGTDAEFVVAGQGPAEADLRRVAERLGVADRVTFAAPPEDDSPFWKVVDVYGQTSLTPYAGRELAAALARGVPSVASDVEGLRAWVDDGRAGRLVPPADADALAGAIRDLLADPVAARDLGGRGRSFIAAGFDPAREADALTALYRRALSSDRAPAPMALLAARTATPRS